MDLIPPSNNFIINKKGFQLHFREFIKSPYPDAIFYFHGFNGNINKSYLQNFANMVLSSGINFFALDFQGHGYSQGKPSYIEDYQDLIDDAILFIKNRDKKHSFRKIALIGSSMGGAVVSQVLSHFNEKVFGAVLLAPCFIINENNNNPKLEFLLENFFIKYLPETSIPKFLCSGIDPQHCFKNIPKNFSHNPNLPFKSAHSLIQLSKQCLNTTGIQKKIFIIHDPEDKITSYQGSQIFTNFNPQTELIPLTNSLHNILYNDMDVVLVYIYKLFF